MEEKFTLKEIVEETFKDYGSIIGRIKNDGYQFDFDLCIDNSDYPKEFSDNSRLYLNNALTELILNSLKANLRIKDIVDVIEGNYDKTVFNEKTPKIEIGLKTEKDNYLISVSDNGPGIPPENLSKIWGKDFSTFGTSGIGLSFMRKQSYKYSGWITVESELDKGTTFYISILR